MTRSQIQSMLLFVVLLVVVVSLFVLPRSLNLWRQKQGAGMKLPESTAFPLVVTDTCSHAMLIKQRPTRIVSLAPGVTEILFAIGAGDRVAADTAFCNYPEAAKKLPKIGGYLDPNVEKITAIKPDLILGERGNKKDVLDRLYTLGLPIVVIDPTKLVEIPQAIKLVGRVTGQNAASEKLAEDFAAREATVRKKLELISVAGRPRTLFLFSLDDQGGVFTVGPGSHIDELITVSGGRNIARDTDKPWPQLSMETVAAADPQVIMVLDMQDHAGKHLLSREDALKRLAAKTNWRGVSAVKDGKVYIVDSDTTSRPGPRLIDGLEAMAAILHPEIFKSEGKP